MIAAKTEFKKKIAVVLASLLVMTGIFTVPVKSAEETKQGKDPVKTEPISNEELIRRMDILAEEVEKVKVGRQLFVPAKKQGQYGLGPAASKVYETNEGLSIGAYGEVIYENYADKNQKGADSGKIDQIDALRQILYLGYRFDERILFNSEIEIEHADEIYLEFAYFDFLLSEYFNIRTGMMLAPMGFINELHEPPMYLGAKRPLTERVLIPTTWREIGAGIFGSIGDFNYKLYIMNSFDGQKFRAADGVRNGRQKGSQAKAEDFTAFARLDFKGIDNSLFGISGSYGNTGQNNSFNAPVFIGDIHAEFKYQGFHLRGLFAYSTIGDVSAINQLNGYTGSNSIGEKLIGYYAETGYDIFRLIDTTQELVLFVGFEKVNTQFSVPTGYTSNPANDQTVITAGFSYKPIFNIAFKADYQWIANKADTGVNQFNLGMGYMF